MSPEHLSTIQRVARIIGPKYTFGYLGPEDVIQECVLFGMEAYDRWDGVRPFENFIAVHISNRIKNFKRDNYYRPHSEDFSQERREKNEAKRALMSPQSLNIDMCYELEYELDKVDELEFLYNTLPHLLRNDFKRLLDGVVITRSRKEKVYQAVREILGEDWTP